MFFQEIEFEKSTAECHPFSWGLNELNNILWVNKSCASRVKNYFQTLYSMMLSLWISMNFTEV